MRWSVFVLLLIHGLLHFLGFAKAFGLAEIARLSQPISRWMGLLWGIAGLAFLVSAFLLQRSPRMWWIVALGAVALSQTLIVSAWGDARFGTVANLLVLAAALYGFASEGPLSLRREYRSAVEEALAASLDAAAPLTEAARSDLPEPVRRYLEVTGWAERPRPLHVRSAWRGRIRGGPDEPWMTFTAEQHNFPSVPARFFLMDARRSGLPVDVLHVYRRGHATMRVRLLSLFPLVNARGPAMDRAETVTVLNDMALLAPGALTDPAIRWEPVDDHTARARYTVGEQSVEAVLHFGETGELVDFVSDDRMAASADGRSFEPMRWSTPVEAYRAFDGRRAPSRGVGLWHPDEGEAYAYFEGEIIELEVHPDARRTASRSVPRPPDR